MNNSSTQPKRILVRGVNWLGDAVMSLPALLRLREAQPHAHVALLVAEKLAELWRAHPSLDEVIPFLARDGVGQVSKKLRAHQFDVALILPNSFRSAFESWLAGIPTRIGYAGNGRKPLLTSVVPPRSEHILMRKKSPSEIKRLVAEVPLQPRQTFPISGHHLHQYLRLVTVLGGTDQPLAPSIKMDPKELASFREKFALPQRGAHPVIGLNPGAEYGPAKRWPIEYFLQAARNVSEQVHPHWVIFGGPGDRAAAKQLAAGIQREAVHNLAGSTTLRELAAGLALCDVVLTNDTGPMHLAAAVGTRVVVPFGSTSPELTGPGLPSGNFHRALLGNVPCAPCFLRVCPIDFRCMHSISPSAVAEALLRSIRPSD